MAPRRKRAAVTPTIAEEEVKVPKVDTPFVAWMKEQEAAGIRKGRLVSVTDHRAPHVTTASAMFSPSVDGGGIGTDVDNDNYDGLDAADNVDSDIDTYYDSDGYTGADVVDDTEGRDTPAEEAGSSRKGKRKVAHGRSKKSHWSEEELTEFAAAMWFCKDDFDKMKGKQGAQPWKKLRRVLRDANPKWVQPYDADPICSATSRWRSSNRAAPYDPARPRHVNGASAVCRGAARGRHGQQWELVLYWLPVWTARPSCRLSHAEWICTPKWRRRATAASLVRTGEGSQTKRCTPGRSHQRLGHREV
ncbi:unnamed protein product [Closterium sp. NIES-54]